MREFFFKLHSAGLGEFVELCFAPGFGVVPRSANPSLLLQAMQGGIESALRYLQDLCAYLFNPFGDGQPCFGPSTSVLRMSRSNVPWIKSDGLLTIRHDA